MKKVVSWNPWKNNENTFNNRTLNVSQNQNWMKFWVLPNKPRSEKRLREKFTSKTTIDKVHLKCICIQRSFVEGKRESILISFSLSAPRGFESHKEPTSKLFKKVNGDQ